MTQSLSEDEEGRRFGGGGVDRKKERDRERGKKRRKWGIQYANHSDIPS